MRFPAYPKYQPSGVDWLGELPEHWEVKRLKTAANYWVSNVDKIPSEDEIPVRLCNYTDVYYNDRIEPGMTLMETTATAEEIRRFGLCVGDILLTKDSEEWNDIAIPARVVQTAPDLVCGYHLAIVRPDSRSLHSPFLLRALQSCAVNQQFQIAATGVTRYGLPKSSIGEAQLPLPPPLEQSIIANFLDAETAKIETLVAKKRELIEKLKEKRSALVSYTVTRGLTPEAARAAGLNPNPKLKPSGIEWLGEIPEHWMVRRLKFYLLKMEQGWSPQCENIPAIGEEWGVLKVGAVNGGQFNPMENKRLPEGEQVLSEYEIRVGDFLISRANTRELLGAAAQVRSIDSRLLLCDKLYRLKLKPEELNPDFLLFYMRSIPGHFEFEREATGASDSMQNISQGAVKNLWVAIPSSSEQRAIADYLDRETNKIDRMVAKVEEAIERLQEYRTALISAAVTGKIDVRNVRQSGENRTSGPANDTGHRPSPV